MKPGPTPYVCVMLFFAAFSFRAAAAQHSIATEQSVMPQGAQAAQQQEPTSDSSAQQPTRESREDERRALDPLTPEEQTAAERIALNDPRVRELVAGPGVRVISAVPVIIKPEGEVSPEKLDLQQRQIELVLFRPGNEAGARVVVSMQRSAVQQVTRLAANQVPMNDDDLTEATQLALREGEVQKMLGPEAQNFRPLTGVPDRAGAPENGVSGLPVRSMDPKDPCSRHRFMELQFRRGHDYLNVPAVVVDLTARHVTIERRNTK